MEIKLVVPKTLMPSVPSAKAYQLIFTDEYVYFLFLSRDWGGFGGVGVSVLGKNIVSAAGGISHDKIAEKLKEIEDQNLDELVEKEKNSVKIRYENLVNFKQKKKSLWGGNAFVQFKCKKGNSSKFTFDEETPREAIIEIIKEKRPDLL